MQQRRQQGVIGSIDLNLYNPLRYVMVYCPLEAFARCSDFSI